MTTDIMTDLALLNSPDPGVLADPYPVYARLREAGPVVWAEGPAERTRWREAWHVFGFASVLGVLRSPAMSSRSMMAPPPGWQNEDVSHLTEAQRYAREYFWRALARPMMITMDVPEHTRLRRLVTAAFTPKMTETLRGPILEIVDDLLGAVANESSFDLMSAFAFPLPTRVISRLLGAPAGDWERINHWTSTTMTGAPNQESFDNYLELSNYWASLIAARRESPRDDLISALTRARDEGEMLSDEELIGQCILLMSAGHETLSYALGSAVLNLLRHNLWTALPDYPIDNAVEELLRFDAPFQRLSRVVSRPTTIEGQAFGPGEKVVIWLGGANRDPDQFPDPDRLILDRKIGRQLAFGFGTHFCLGAALARLEMHIALPALRERFPALRLATETVPRKPFGLLRGPVALPVLA